MSDSTVWMDLLEYARWSPSPHNVQPWKVKIISDTKAEIYYQPSRLLYIEDYTGKFTIAGFGIFVEYLDIAAHAKGYKITETYNNILLDEKQQNPTLFATLHLVKTTEKDELTPDLILKRRTSRLPYNGKPVELSVLRKLESVAAKYGHSFTFSEDQAMLDWILALNRDTIFYDMNDTATREEINGWLRFNYNQAHHKKDGLWSYCMIVPGILLYLFFNIRWLFNIPGINAWAKYYYLRSTNGTKTVGWLTGPFNKPHEWLKAGRMLGRLWLYMTKYGVYLHPFGSIITNNESHKRLREKFNVDESKNVMWLIMRLGYSKEPPRSLRLEVEDLLYTDTSSL